MVEQFIKEEVIEVSSKGQIMEIIEVDHVEETKLSQPKHIPACRSVFRIMDDPIVSWCSVNGVIWWVLLGGLHCDD